MPLHKAIISGLQELDQSGKTRTLTYRIVNLILKHKVDRKYPGCYLYQQSSAGDERAHPEVFCGTVGAGIWAAFWSLAANRQTQLRSRVYHKRLMDRHIP